VLVHEDHGATAKELRAPRDGTAVIAVGCAGDGDVRTAAFDLSVNRIGAAERLEAVQAEAWRLVLVPERV
jgi:hypothetical protein